MYVCTMLYTSVPDVSLESQQYAVAENIGNLTVVITRQGDASARLTLQFQASSGTAELGIDFEIDPNFTEIEFLPGEVRREVVINIIDEQLPEANETFSISISYSGNDTIMLSRTEANVTILNDDSKLVSLLLSHSHFSSDDLQYLRSDLWQLPTPLTRQWEG